MQILPLLLSYNMHAIEHNHSAAFCYFLRNLFKAATLEITLSTNDPVLRYPRGELNNKSNPKIPVQIVQFVLATRCRGELIEIIETDMRASQDQG